MEKNGYKNTPHRFSLADQIKGGQAKSLRKTLAVRLNPMKNPSTLKRELEEVLDKNLNADALKNILRLANEKNGQILIDEMVEVLIEMKKIVSDEPTLAKYDLYLKRLIDFKTAIWGTKLIVETNEDTLLHKEFLERLKVVEVD
ncbi:MAG: hypothetical protein ABID38_05805 [Candidatus Diapherotrites archaeon]